MNISSFIMQGRPVVRTKKKKKVMFCICMLKLWSRHFSTDETRGATAEQTITETAASTNDKSLILKEIDNKVPYYESTDEEEKKIKREYRNLLKGLTVCNGISPATFQT